MRKALTRFALILAAWFPFFLIWVLFSLSYGHATLGNAVAMNAIIIGTAGLLGIGVWHACRRWPWPLRLTIRFYLLHAALAVAYTLLWNASICALESIRLNQNVFRTFWRSPAVGYELLTGVWVYCLIAGVSYAVETRNRLHQKETHAMHVEALANAARLDAIRARLNPHFLYNALHTLAALVKFRPALAEGAIERLGDMLRYALQEDGRELVSFSEEYGFTQQYLSFEQLRYESRLRVEMQIDPESQAFDIPPFSIQTLAENAVRHAISIRPEGGSIWIITCCRDGRLIVTVRDDGPGEAVKTGASNQFGLRSLRERLRAAYGPSVDLLVHSGPEGFEARFEVPATNGEMV